MGNLIERRSVIGIVLASLMVLSAFAGMIMIIPGTADGTFRYVGPNSTYANLQDALNDASSGDIIVLGDGVHTGTFRSDTGSIVIRGNSSMNTILDLNGSAPSHIGGDGVLFRNLMITNGTIWFTGNNQNLTNLIVDSSDATVVMENSTGSMVENITFINPRSTGLLLYNCTSIKMDILLSTNVSGELIMIGNSTNIMMGRIMIELNSSATAILADSVYGLRMNDMLITSINGANTGVFIGNSTFVSIGNSSFPVEGKGIKIEISDQVLLFENDHYPPGNGSVGIQIELVTNLTMEDIEGYSEFDSDIVDVSMSQYIEFKNSSLTIDGSSSGLKLNGATNFNGHKVVIEGNGDDSMGFDVKNSNSLEMTDLTYTGTGSGSIFLEISSVEGIVLNNSDISVDGDDSIGVSQKETVKDLICHDLVIDISGKNSRGFDMEDLSDSWIHSNYITIGGERSAGMYASGTNLSLTGNLFTISGKDANGATLSGADIFASSERWFAIGDKSVALAVIDLMSLGINGCRADSSGMESSTLLLSGMSGTYNFIDSFFIGNSDVSDLAVIDDGASILKIDNTTFQSASQENALTLTTLTTLIKDSSISGVGVASFFMDSPSIMMVDTDISGMMPIRSSGSNVDIIDCDLGTSPQTLEANSNSMIHVYNTPMNGALVDPTSVVLTSNSISFETIDRSGNPIPGVNVQILSNGNPIYETPFFNDTNPDPVTDINGIIQPIMIDHMIYNGNSIPEEINNTIKIHLEGTAEVTWDIEETINSSSPGKLTYISPDIDLPKIPQGLEAIALDTREGIRISWIPNDDDTTEYRIFELDTEDMSTWSIIDTVDHPLGSWLSEDLGPAVRKIYRITARDGSWESAPSIAVSVWTKDLTPPPAPSELTAGEVTQNSITLKWNHEGSNDLDHFSLLMNGTIPGEMIKVAEIPADQREYTIEGLAWGTTYTFRLNAIDTEGNPSLFTADFEAKTAMILLSVQVNVNYSSEGPLAGMSVFNGTVSLISFNGTIVSSGNLDVLGKIQFTGLELDEIYRIHVIPPEEFLGQMNLSSGYIPILSSNFQVFENNTLRNVQITLPYYQLPSTGTIEVNVQYGTGPRNGAAYQATVQLMNSDDNIVDEGLTDADGKISFIITDIPFRGRFHVEPPSGIGGDQTQGISGYLSQTTNFFDLDVGDPDYGTFTVDLIYYEYFTPPDPVLIDRHYPMGGSVTLDSEIVIDFNQPMAKDTVVASVKVIPPLAGIVYSWDPYGRNLTISHDGFLPEKEYTVVVEFGATSLADTSFPADYSDNEWTFTTVADEDENGSKDGGISQEVLWAVLIGLIVIIIIVGFYIFSSRNKNDEMDEDDVYALSDEEYDDEEYPEDDDLLDGEMGDFPDDEEYYDDEEYLEEGEYPDEELEEDIPIEEDEIEGEDEVIDEDDMMEEEEEDIPEVEDDPIEETPSNEEIKDEEKPVKEKKKGKRKKNK